MVRNQMKREGGREGGRARKSTYLRPINQHGKLSSLGPALLLVLLPSLRPCLAVHQEGSSVDRVVVASDRLVDRNVPGRTVVPEGGREGGRCE